MLQYLRPSPRYDISPVNASLGGSVDEDIFFLPIATTSLSHLTKLAVDPPFYQYLVHIGLKLSFFLSWFVQVRSCIGLLFEGGSLLRPSPGRSTFVFKPLSLYPLPHSWVQRSAAASGFVAAFREMRSWPRAAALRVLCGIHSARCARCVHRLHLLCLCPARGQSWETQRGSGACPPSHDLRVPGS